MQYCLVRDGTVDKIPLSRGGPVLLTARPTTAVAAMIAIAIVAARAPRADAQARSSAAPATTGACSLLTKQDAQAALGEPVTGPRSTGGRTPQEPSACEYTGSGLHKVNLNLMPLAPDMAAMYKAMCAQKTNDGLAGLGDIACWYNPKHEELQVMKGTTFFSIELHKSGDPTEAIKGVAKQALTHLK